MVLVAVADDGEAEEGKENEEHVTELAALLPWGNLGRVSILVQIVNATVQPVTVTIDMELVEVTELVQRMVFQVVSHNLILFSGLGLILESVSSHQSGALELYEVLRIVAWVLPTAESSSWLVTKALNAALH